MLQKPSNLRAVHVHAVRHIYFRSAGWVLQKPSNLRTVRAGHSAVRQSYVVPVLWLTALKTVQSPSSALAQCMVRHI